MNLGEAKVTGAARPDGYGEVSFDWWEVCISYQLARRAVVVVRVTVLSSNAAVAATAG